MVLLSDYCKKSIEYPLVAMKMTASQCQHIKSPALCTTLQASGLPSNTKRDIVSGPPSLIGLKNGSLYGTQGSKHIPDLMNIGNIKCITGQHLRDLIEAHKLCIGCSGSLFYNDFSLLLKCTPTSCIINI